MLSLSILTGYDLIKNRKYLVKSPYFNSYEFDMEIYSYCSNLHNFHIAYKNFDYKVAENKVTKEQLADLKLFYEDMIRNSQKDIGNKYISILSTAAQSDDKDKFTKLTQEKNKELKEVEKENTKTEAELRKEIALWSYNDYKNIKKAIESKKEIKYYIKNSLTKEVYTNLAPKTNIDSYIKNNSIYSISFPLKSGKTKNFLETNNLLNSLNWEGNIIITKDFSSNGYISKNYNYYNSIRDRLIKEIIVGISSLIMGIVILIIFKRRNYLNSPMLNKVKGIYNNIPLDLKLFIFILYTAIMGSYLINLSFFYKPLGINHFIVTTLISIYALYFIFNFKYAIKLKKDKNEFLIQYKGSLINKLLNVIKNSNFNKNIKLKLASIITFSALLGAFILLLLLLGFHNILSAFIITILYIILLIIYLFKKADYLNEILKATEKMSCGNLDYVIKEKGESVLGKIAHNINNMKEGYKKSLEEQVKSERLKTELITNVSHDLKTPLTSIINYIDLLKKEDLSKDEINGYISVLDRKSKRLKALIEDLFEASKMSSGAVELNIEKINVTALLKQALGEFEEKIKKSSLQLKFKCTNNKAYANLDGKKTWRVFENLINNIIKYSQPNTRVYIDLIETNTKIIITMKNVSRYEMDFSADEIFERFKRGDKARNTDGSGLGLAIAKSISELQGGSLNIIIDGDLFKVIVEFNK
ncbi:sensor histidine kinase [Clostridium botulinum]|uniref:histidine kinase n=1 Tax=Clostridium botulinum (strain Okra / Type B1) TaxID=498213 RepID=B1ILE7_CLOBK|nr:histidine kinase dimerization/phospho-acceptor domain-containing protein [Clostridium botulinum]ACA44614.1 sensor histidine kinase [Clostridium botulinum B1 str. Okra]MBD5562376.1 sensor histidine kinase [Clostridium botulinum]MBD5566111.1 sensor histidine kinase [Clostridium botulinum]MBD5569373.1 sensor histidine kinase [Clostridium botulinum]MBD5572289.1 sensor histidine kinase [Clostridium botulinum]